MIKVGIKIYVSKMTYASWSIYLIKKEVNP